MITTIALKEFYTNLVSFRFALGFLLCLFLIPFTMVVSIHDYSSRQREYEMERKQAEENNKPRVYSALRPQLVRPPEPLSIFSGGISGQVGNSVTILLGEKPMLAEGGSTSRENPLMNAFFSLDFVTILTIIMSLLALLFTYDACSGEREKGTLKLVLTHSMRRSTFLIGKAAGIALTLFPVMLFCYLLSALIILCHKNVAFGPDEWVRIVMMFFMSVLLFLLFMALGLFVSTRVRSSVTSIVVCLFLWVTFVFIVPNAAVYAARSFIRTGTQESLRFAFAELDREYDNKCGEYRKTIPPPDAWMHWNNNCHGEYREISGCSRSLNEFYRRLSAYSEPLRCVYADKKWILQKEYLGTLDRQRRIAERLALLSPSEMFQQAVSALCGTDVSSYTRYLEATRRYRDELIRFFEEKEVFSSFLYFTGQDPATFMTADEIIRTSTGGQFQNLQEFSGWAEAHNGDFSPMFKVDLPGTDMNSFKPLDQSDVPKFHEDPLPLTRDVKRSLPNIAGLILGCVVLFFLAFVSFTRYDAR